MEDKHNSKVIEKEIQKTDYPNNNGQAGEEEDIESVPFFKKKRIIIPFLFLVVLAGIGWYWYMGNKGYVSTDDAFIDGDKATISSKVLGRVIKLTVDEGDSVKQGQVLAQLDLSELDAQVKQSQAMIQNAKENISLSKVNLDRAKEDFDRTESQYHSKIVPKEQYDHALRAVQAAQADYDITKSKVDAATAQLNVIKTQLQNGNIASPINGVVAKRWILQGDIVQPGQPIYTVNDTKNIWVTAQFEETKLQDIIPGDTVEISVDAYPDRKFFGKVAQLGLNTSSQFSLIPPNNASGNFTKVTQRVPVKISINDYADAGSFPLLPGMSVEVRVKEAK